MLLQSFLQYNKSIMKTRKLCFSFDAPYLKASLIVSEEFSASLIMAKFNFAL